MIGWFLDVGTLNNYRNLQNVKNVMRPFNLICQKFTPNKVDRWREIAD